MHILFSSQHPSLYTLRPPLKIGLVTLAVSSIFLALAYDCSLPLEITLLTEASIVALALIALIFTKKRVGRPDATISPQRFPIQSSASLPTATATASFVPSFAPRETSSQPIGPAYSRFSENALYDFVFAGGAIDWRDFCVMRSVHRRSRRLDVKFFVRSHPSHLQQIVSQQQSLTFLSSLSGSGIRDQRLELQQGIPFHTPFPFPLSSLKFVAYTIRDSAWSSVSSTLINLEVHDPSHYLRSWDFLLNLPSLSVLKLKTTSKKYRPSPLAITHIRCPKLQELHLDTGKDIDYRTVTFPGSITTLALHGDPMRQILLENICPQLPCLTNLILSKDFYDKEFLENLQQIPLINLTVGTTLSSENINALIYHPTLQNVTLTLLFPINVKEKMVELREAIDLARSEKIRSLHIRWERGYGPRTKFSPDSQLVILYALQQLGPKIASIYSRFPEIFSPEMQSSLQELPPTHFTNLIHFTYDNEYESAPICLSSFLNHFPNITHLRLIAKRIVINEMGPYELRALRTTPLQSLFFRTARGLPSALLDHLAQKEVATTLTSLSLGSLDSADITSKSALLSHLLKTQSLRLKSLQLENITVDDALLQTLVTSQRALNYIMIRHNHTLLPLTREGILTLRQLPLLQGLNISECAEKAHQCLRTVVPYWDGEEV